MSYSNALAEILSATTTCFNDRFISACTGSGTSLEPDLPGDRNQTSRALGDRDRIVVAIELAGATLDATIFCCQPSLFVGDVYHAVRTDESTSTTPCALIAVYCDHLSTPTVKKAAAETTKRTTLTGRKRAISLLTLE